MGCGRRLVNCISPIKLFKSNHFLLFCSKKYREIVRNACIASFPVDRPALALTAADRIETENFNFNFNFFFAISVFNQFPEAAIHASAPYWALTFMQELRLMALIFMPIIVSIMACL